MGKTKRIIVGLCVLAALIAVLIVRSQSVKPISQEAESALSGGSNILVVYFSYSGNTQTVARDIQKATGADIFRITVTDEYPSSYNAMSDRTSKEQEEQARPELKDSIDTEKWASYDTIFFGYPNWWGDMPMPMYTFLESYDFEGKTIYPFVTSDSSGFSGTISSIQNAAKGATVNENGLSITASHISSSESSVKSWIDELGLNYA